MCFFFLSRALLFLAITWSFAIWILILEFRAALEELRAKLATMAPNERNTLLGRKPELKFLGFTQDQIMKKHVNDFKGVTTQNLDETEARALYACMPAFRKEQVRLSDF